MNVLARMLAQKAAEAHNKVDADTFVTIALFCAIGLIASLCMAIYGPDLKIETILGFY
jgi:hypothetical protein